MVKYKASIGPYFWGFYVRGSRFAKVWAISSNPTFCRFWLAGVVVRGEIEKKSSQ